MAKRTNVIERMNPGPNDFVSSIFSISSLIMSPTSLILSNSKVAINEFHVLVFQT